MDHLKAYQTNVQAIGSIESVQYRVYTVKHNGSLVSSATEEASPEVLQDAVSQLRNSGLLVARDTRRKLLWTFRSAAQSPDQSLKDAVESAVANTQGFIVQLNGQGEMKASELARPQARMNALGSAQSSLHRSAQAANARAAQANANIPLSGNLPALDPKPFDLASIYEHFIAAVLDTLTHDLIRVGRFVPLNFRTLVEAHPPTKSQQVVQSCQPLSNPKLLCLDAYWTAAATIFVSWKVEVRPGLRTCDDVSPLLSINTDTKTFVRLAPSGRIAYVLNEDIANGSNRRLSDKTPGPHKRQKLQDISEKSAKWRAAVDAWFRRLGLNTENSANIDEWIIVYMERSSILADSAAGSDGDVVDDVCFLWPRYMCIIYTSDDLGELSAGSDFSTYATPPAEDVQIDEEIPPKLSWFLGIDRNRSLGGFHTADTWLADSKRRATANEGPHHAKETIHPTSVQNMADVQAVAGAPPNSPLRIRPGVLGDLHLQPLGGVYPTPPDGVAPQGNMPGSLNELSMAQQKASHLSAVPQPSVSDSGIPTSVIKTEQSATQSTRKNSYRKSMDSANGDDDLFEAMDDESLAGNHITDADFSFFDDDDHLPDPMDIESEITKPEESLEEPAPAPVLRSPTLPDGAIAGHSHGNIPSTQQPDGLYSTRATQPQNGAVNRMRISPQNGARVESQSGFPSSVIQTTSSTLMVKSELLSGHDIEILHTPVQLPHSTVPAQLLRKESVFDPINFAQKLSLSDSKYADGRFKFESASPERAASSQTPMTLNQRNAERHSTLRDAHARSRPSPSNRTKQSGGSFAGLPKVAARVSDHSDESSASENESDGLDRALEITGNKEDITHNTYAKRKRAVEDVVTPRSVNTATTPSQHSTGLDATVDEMLVLQDPTLLQRLESSPWDWSLVRYPAPFGRLISDQHFLFSSAIDPKGTQQTASEPERKNDRSQEAIHVAQVFTDQIITSSMPLRSENATHPTDLYESSDDLVRSLHRTMTKHFTNIEPCQLARYAATCDPLPELPHAVKAQQQQQQQQRPLARRTNTAPPGADGGIGSVYTVFPIAPPSLRLKRADVMWDLLPSSLHFWETLGLGPASEPKNVMAYCIYPSHEGLQEHVGVFLDNVSLAYEGCKLGTHFRGFPIEDHDDGLVPCPPLKIPTYDMAISAIQAACIMLGEQLPIIEPATNEQDKVLRQVNAFVVYIVDPFESRRALWDICMSFWRLWETYRAGIDLTNDEELHVDIVLQVVPMSYIASFDGPVMLEPTRMGKLAREVYDRCPPTGPSGDRSPLNIFVAPSIQLEESLPRAIPFRTNSEPPADLMREFSHLHVAYAMALDYSWVTVTITDITGKYQSCVSYGLLGTRAFADVARETWFTLLDIIKKRKVSWRICVAKAGWMNREETELWASLATQPSQLHLCTAILCIDDEPPMQLLPSGAFMTSNAQSSNGLMTTPVGTPQPAVSPEPPSITPATPTEMQLDAVNDPDARLVDMSDETWGLVLGHRLNNSPSAVELRPSLASGMLIKRGTEAIDLAAHTDTDFIRAGPITLGVNLVWLGAVQPNRTPQTSINPLQSPNPLSGDSSGAPGNGLNSPGVAERASGIYSAITATQRATAESFLKDILIQYRALGLLAKAKGLRGTKGGIIPWHVAAAKRAATALGQAFDGPGV